jgi:hypothetical protein
MLMSYIIIFKIYFFYQFIYDCVELILVPFIRRHFINLKMNLFKYFFNVFIIINYYYIYIYYCLVIFHLIFMFVLSICFYQYVIVIHDLFTN